jgi:hypothetical protein
MGPRFPPGCRSHSPAAVLWARYLGKMKQVRKPKDTKESPSASLKRLTDYFSWRQPYRGDEATAADDAKWALSQTQKNPEDLAVFILETVNERNMLQRRLRAVSAIATNQDFVEDATVESVEWAFGKRLKPKK